MAKPAAAPKPAVPPSRRLSNLKMVWRFTLRYPAHLAAAALSLLVAASATLKPVLLVGAALRRNGRLYNCAVAISRGRILGVVPKSYLPNYREYYEKRWFALGAGLAGLEIELAGQTVPFGTDLIFAAEELPDFVFHAEICEDYWAPLPPSTEAALAGE